MTTKKPRMKPGVVSYDGQPENEYERQRAERIKRNNAVLEQMGLHAAAQRLADVHRKPPSKPASRKAPTKRTSKALDGVRKCSRLSNRPDKVYAEPKLQALNAEHEDLMELADYFAWKGIEAKPLSVSGQYQGWVCRSLIERYGIPKSEEEASQLGNGRGGKSAKSGGKMHGWSTARAHSATLLTNNPNAYFYRHVAPHEEQAQGDWTEEEHDLFMETVRQHGAGDKWGLFASHIPSRVGYQCSAYYRDTVITRGLVFDHRFRMTRTGKAVYIG